MKDSSISLKISDWRSKIVILTPFNLENLLGVSSNCMAHIYKKNEIKFHAKPKNFRRVEKVSFGKKHYKLYIDKNDSVWDIKECQVLSWKTIEKGRKKINVPDVVQEVRDLELYNIVRGNPFKIAANRVIAELEYRQASMDN